MLKFSSLSKKYGNKDVLHVGDAILPEGIVWLKGANGAGKSTLMRCAAGMLPFKGDSILIQGNISLKRDSIRYRKHVNISEAEPTFPSFMKGEEIINFFMKAKEGKRAQISNLINALDAPSFIGQKIETYSSGMKKKLSLILAFIGTPHLILLDEPLITLDDHAQNTIRHYLRKFAEEGGNIMISSHQRLDFSPYSVHEITLASGRLVYQQRL